MKKTNKLLKMLIACVVVITVFGLNNNVHAAKTTGDVLDAAKSWMSTGESGSDELMQKVSGYNGDPVGFFVKQLIGVGQILVGIGIATIVIVSVIMAIRWITATPDKKAKLQQQLIGLVVAIFVIFGAIGIWNLVRGIMGNVETTLEGETKQSVVLVANNENQIK